MTPTGRLRQLEARSSLQQLSDTRAEVCGVLSSIATPRGQYISLTGSRVDDFIAAKTFTSLNRFYSFQVSIISDYRHAFFLFFFHPHFSKVKLSHFISIAKSGFLFSRCPFN